MTDTKESGWVIMEMKPPRVLCCDVALVNTGWAVLEVGPKTPERLLAGGVIRTYPEHESKIKGADTIRRVREIAKHLDKVISTYSPALLVAELPYGSQHASSAVAQGICYGVVGTLSQVRGLALELVTPQAAKRAVCGHRNASKERVQELIFDSWPEAATWQGYEHIADALAVLVSVRDTTIYRMLQSVTAQGG